MAEDKLNLNFFSSIPYYNCIDNGKWYEFKIPHVVQLKDIVLHFDYVDYTNTIKAIENMKNILDIYNLPKDFNGLVDKLETYKNDYDNHPHINNLRMFDRIEVKSENLNCMISYPQFTEFRQKYLSFDKILSLPPETITYNTEIKIVRNNKYYKPNELYITIHCNEPDFVKLSESEKYKLYPNGIISVSDGNYKHYKTNDTLIMLSRYIYINTELSKDIKEIYLIHKNEVMLDGCVDLGFRSEHFKVYIDYKLTDITKFSKLFNYLKQHKTTCVNIVFDDNITSDNFEDYYIYYKSIAKI